MARRRSSRGAGEGLSSLARRSVEESELREAVANLATLDLAGLRLQWRNVFSGTAPLHLPKPLLARILAYRLQADALGDLPDVVRRTLEGFRARSLDLSGQAAADGSSCRRRIKPGSILIREWNGRLQRVTALEEGFAWEGKTYRSLSKVAWAITGGHWNGPRFCGLTGSKGMGRAAAAIASTEQVQTSRVDKKRQTGRPMKRRPGARSSSVTPSRRGAVYTRVSTDHGLEQDFNSLDAQREAGEAYIHSRAHEGCMPAHGRYDDGGYSGASLGRPALQGLLDVVRQRQIDVIVVYKVDRLTRSLADFAKLVELFDAHDVSFISITQSFNTTTSMERLTLNMLLSFAQFEREVTGERIRDKIAASKKRGLWVGGVVPLGYKVVDRKLMIDEAEAPIVRLIFERYCALGSMIALMRELRDREVVTRLRTRSSGRAIGGIAFTKGPLGYLLKNRMYLGEINHGQSSYAGEHPAIVDEAVFDKAQEILTRNAAAKGYSQSRSQALLVGRLYDDRGHRMTPSFAMKRGVRYRYCVSRAVTEGRNDLAGSVVRVPASMSRRRFSTRFVRLPPMASPPLPAMASESRRLI
jgi:DNA invertase Pin-like site-specific DNA recombinase